MGQFSMACPDNILYVFRWHGCMEKIIKGGKPGKGGCRRKEIKWKDRKIRAKEVTYV
jgi:hypothetical protein